MMNEFKIEQDVPLPPRRNGSDRRKYPLREMAVGDSIFVALNDGVNTRKVYHSISMAITYEQKRSTSRFTRRTVEGGIRVWRYE